jgi:hypothetical protein
MNYWRLAGSTALVSLGCALPVLAAVTPEEIWQDWQDRSAAYGQTLTTRSVERDGDTLVVSGLNIAYDKDEVSAKGMVDELRLRDAGDGSVEITMSDTIPLEMTVPAQDAGGAPTTINLSVNQPGLVITADGDAMETSYDFAGPELSVTLDKIEGADTAAMDLSASFSMANIAGKYLFSEMGDKTRVLTSYQADSMTAKVEGSGPPADGMDGPSAGTFNLTVADISGTTNGTLLDLATMENMSAALKAGFASDGTVMMGATNYDLNVTDAKGETKINGTVDSTTLNFALDQSRLAYGGGAKGVTLTASGGEIPFPELKLAYSESAFNLLLPVTPSDQPGDFALLTKLVDLTVSDEIWGIFDPTAQLPRDPATIAIDLKGTATVKADLMDPKAMENIGSEGPGELNSLNIDELHVKIAGADMAGDGAFTFDNTDLATYGGMPAPTGKLNLKLVGGNTLMDKLVAMGLLPQDQVMGFRMMLSMFANAGPGEDELNSTLEFKDGGFYANGQRLQ